MAQIAHDRDGFQEDFRQRYRRTEVQINAAAVEFPDDGREEFEIAITCRADGRAVGMRMDVG